jgi:hypothetical protein
MKKGDGCLACSECRSPELSDPTRPPGGESEDLNGQEVLDSQGGWSR